MKLKSPSAGFSLTEVTLALGIVAFCALSVMGMLPLAAKFHRQSYDQIQASNLLCSVANSFHSPITNSGSTNYYLGYPLTNVLITSSFSNSFSDSGTPTNSSSARYSLTCTNVAPGATGYGGRAYLRVAWPPNGSLGSVETVVYYNLPSR